MFKIPRKQFFQIADGCNELAEKSGRLATPFSFKRFTRRLKAVNYTDSVDVSPETIAAIKSIAAKDKASIEFVGRGSSRIAFALDDGQCVKVAMSIPGIAQNKQEVASSLKYAAEYPFFPTTIDHDPEYKAVLTCLCTDAMSKDFNDAFGSEYSFDCIMELLYWFIEYANNLAIPSDKSLSDAELFTKVAKDIIDRRYNKKADDDIMNVIRILLDFQGHSQLKYQILRKLFMFYLREKDADSILCHNDIRRIENWGLAIIDKQTCFIIIDAGLSDAVFDSFYKNNR